MDALSLTKQMYQAILKKDMTTQQRLRQEMIQYNLQLHKENKLIKPTDTIFVG